MKLAHLDVLDGCPLVIKTSAVRMILVSSYALGDSYATVQANKLAEVVMTAADYTLTGTSARTLTVASGKTAPLTAAAPGGDSHLVFTDGGSRVLWVTDETNNPTGAIGVTVTFPGVSYTFPQPV